MIELIPVTSFGGFRGADRHGSDDAASSPPAHPAAPAAGRPASGPTASAPVAERTSRGAGDDPVADPIADVVTEGVEELVRAVVAAAEIADGEDGAGGRMGSGLAGDGRAVGYWGTFLGVDPHSRAVVGSCGYRGAPRGGRVEVAFWTFPPFEGRGWASAMAIALVERAFEHPEVEVVLAHTLPERAPATSVLTAAGLRLTGTVRRDERSGSSTVRGRVWRWERRRRG